MFATSKVAIPLGVLTINLSPSGENALSWKYRVDPPASSVSRTTRCPVSTSIHSLGDGSCGRRTCPAVRKNATNSHLVMDPPRLTIDTQRIYDSQSLPHVGSPERRTRVRAPAQSDLAGARGDPRPAWRAQLLDLSGSGHQRPLCLRGDRQRGAMERHRFNAGVSTLVAADDGSHAFE